MARGADPGDQFAVVEQIYAAFDMEMSDVAEARLRGFIDDNGGVETDALALLGDLNATPDSEEIRGLRDGWTDCWAECGEGDGWTWASANPLAAHARWPNRRLDYVLMRTVETTPQPIAARLIGTCPIDGTMPSDHYGVLVDFSP